MRPAPLVVLRDLDARVVPRLALALRSLLDAVRNGPARTHGDGSAPRRGALRRLDDRFATVGPLAVLRDVPQLGVVVVLAVLLTGAGVVLARSDPDRSSAGGPVGAGPASEGDRQLVRPALLGSGPQAGLAHPDAAGAGPAGAGGGGR